ncbi:MAG: hypothetical protein Q8L84_00185 [Hyphomonas sp.]|nr:hypothetical protein [Hyphomonas sp.]
MRRRFQCTPFGIKAGRRPALTIRLAGRSGQVTVAHKLDAPVEARFPWEANLT